MTMRHRVTALLAALVLLATCVGCDKTETPANDGVLENGNVLTALEEGTEAELTAVRENLIKATETRGLGEISKIEFYENGVRTTSDQYVQVKDNKKIYWCDGYKRVVNYTDGYMLDIPDDWKPDFSMSTARSTYSNDNVILSVSDESNAIKVYGSAEKALEAMFGYINTPNYCEKNRVRKIVEETHELIEGWSMYVLKMELQDALPGTKRFYSYVVPYSEQNMTFMMFKSVDDSDYVDVYFTYQPIYNKGIAKDIVSYPESDNPSWNADTKALYDSIKNSPTVKWGVVNGNIDENPLKLKYPTLEKKLDHKFEIVTTYTDQLTYDFPVDKARLIDEDGRVIQFTYHYEYSYGNTMGNVAPILDVYRGELDEEFREFARGVVEYGRPMLFRLNNEMNSDWVTWGAVNAMLDPAIFVETWQRMYNIFEEEGANEFLIWVWNPQGSNTAPMTRWNDLRLYFPGADYVDMLGLTAYNFGTETLWNSFADLYYWLDEYFRPRFGDWAWIISEFGCSDSSELEEHEGRRAQWITEMFDCFEQNRYPNIKAAVWFNANDYDGAGNIVHEIALGRDPASMEAFKEGLDRTQ